MYTYGRCVWVHNCKMNNRSSPTPISTDDSSITPFINTTSSHLPVEANSDFAADIKQEPEDLREEFGTPVVHVSIF